MLLQSLRDAIDAMGLTGLTPEEIAERFTDEEIYAILEMEEQERNEQRFGKFRNLFPDETKVVGDGDWSIYYARRLYPRHVLCFALGKLIRARTFMAANRVGKTVVGGYETSCHLTGLYPHWWEGARFRHPIRAWACGKTNETTRDIVQSVLLGEIEYDGPRKVVDGTGIIPRDNIGFGAGQITWKQGVADLIDTIKIKHVSGGWSKLGIKSYAQGRGSFEGTAQHFIWDDEEPPMDIFSEQIIRTGTTRGRLLLTYTPLEGMSDVVVKFLPDDELTKRVKQIGGRQA